MDCILDKIISTCKKVSENAKHVKINYERLDEIIRDIDLSQMKYWLDSNPFDLLDFDTPTIINFLLVYHTIGDYCFWGDPKWEIETKTGKLDGSFAMMYLLIERLKSGEGFDMSFDEFKMLLAGNVEIPLLQDRFDNLVCMNKFLKEKGKDFYSLVEPLKVDRELFDYIISNLHYFADESYYNGNLVYFYKRAQLLTSDILHVREMKQKAAVDYSHLVGCADYKIPQVMRCYGILEFDDELASLVEQKIEITPGSEMEVEIRACDIVVIDYIARKLNEKVSRIDINDYIWLLGQDKSRMLKPYHRTLTNKY